MSVIITTSAKETKKIGFAFAKNLKKRQINQKQALVVALEGNLGSGKTTFIQGLAAGLGIKESVLSPTFLILKEFTLRFSAKGGPASGWKYFYHIDAYRLKNSVEILELGFKDLIKNHQNLILIEWADRIKKILPKNVLRIKFLNLGGNKRRIVL